ncbi:hypothetical protein [Marinobacterium arenosum]|uniref:hypothetical protein n=1 Tax=Marinobacterium arenosum TaxID=2862496 RepID=UPI001C943736|nr:hypothetical protein [Marinobacterium arenosum]MBY4677169.1 hypothetical protein [Marinobacterium arenosum]
MTENTRVEIELEQEAAELFARYQQITGTTAEQYIGELVVKTLPTLRAIVEAMEEAATSEDPEKVMELFGRKMAQAMVQQRDAVNAAAHG